MEALRIEPKPYYQPARYAEDFITGIDGKKLFIAQWMPQDRPRLIIILLPGLGDHILRFSGWADYFASQHIGVVGMDLPGHGKSEGKRGATRYGGLMKDIRKLLDYVHGRYPSVPKVLYGHCIGGSLVLNYCIRCKPALAGIISSSPWLKPTYPIANVNSFFAKLIIRLFPSFTLTRNMTGSQLTHDTHEVDDYQRDPLVHQQMSLRLLASLEAEGNFILKSKHKIHIPLLLMHGSSDKVTSSHATAEFAKFTSPNTTFKLWKGAYHELHHEYEKMEVFDFILQWINALPGQK